MKISTAWQLLQERMAFPQKWPRLRLNPAGLDRLGAILGLLVLFLFFSFLSPSFRQVQNLVFLAKTTAITIGIVAVGQTIILISGGIDLSVGSVIALTGLISAWLMKNGLGPIPPLAGNLCYLAIGAGWLAGLAIGALQGWLITSYQIPAFIVTLGLMVGLRGLSVGLSNAAAINALPDEFKWFSEGSIGPIPAPVLIMLMVYLGAAYFLRNTKPGRYCYAIGGNETAARLAGINVNRYKVVYYAFSGLLAALAGTILISFIDAAVYTNGDGFQFSSVAAAIIGGNSLTGGVGGVWGTLIGVFLLAIIPSGMIMLNAPPWWRDVITGLIIILAVMIDISRQRKRREVAQPEPPRSVSTGRYLYDLLGKLNQRVEKLAGTGLCRVYLVDRDTGELVPQDLLLPGKIDGQSVLPGKSQIALEAREKGSAVILPDLNRASYARLVLMRPEVQSALALPLYNHDRCVGVLELQSLKGGAFKDGQMTGLEGFTRPFAAGLENAWLFESGWLTRQVRDALRHLWDDIYLGRSPLADWALQERDLVIETTVGVRGEALRDLLLKTIESLKPQDENDPTRSLRCYRILFYTYVQEQAIDQILQQLNVSRRQYFYDLKASIEILADLLVRNCLHIS